ncbi:MAG: DUF2513 domain-containing protein [Dehalococcoidia bacterium]
MKRDLGLIRQILFCLESDDRQMKKSNSRLDNWSDEEIGHHVWLALSAGLIDGQEMTKLGATNREAIPFGLTWAGHDFLDAARDDNVWARVSQLAVVQAGGVTLAVLKELLVRTTRERLGLP